MANTVISPNMNLPVPVVSVDPGPDWANNINSCLGAIDSHNHSSGQGVQISPSGININTDLTMGGNNLTTVRTVRFQTNASPINQPADLGCLYESGVDLYYNDGNGNQVRITQSGSVTGSTGTITGLPSGTASASYAAGTFTFQQATNTPASMSLGPTTINQDVASGFGVTLSPAVAQASNYGIQFPATLPSDTSLVTMDTSGNLSVSNPFASGAYTPTFSDLTNVSLVDNAFFHYARLGSTVIAWGSADVTTIAGNTLTSFNMTVPINRSTAFADTNVSGLAQVVDAGGYMTMGIRWSGVSSTSIIGLQGSTFSGESGIKNTRFWFAYTLS